MEDHEINWKEAFSKVLTAIENRLDSLENVTVEHRPMNAQWSMFDLKNGVGTCAVSVSTKHSRFDRNSVRGITVKVIAPYGCGVKSVTWHRDGEPVDFPYDKIVARAMAAVEASHTANVKWEQERRQKNADIDEVRVMLADLLTEEEKTNPFKTLPVRKVNGKFCLESVGGLTADQVMSIMKIIRGK